jgi:DNA-binding CsgD family transcriptional regulator
VRTCAVPLLEHESLKVRLVASLAAAQLMSADDHPAEAERIAVGAFADAAGATDTVGDPGTHLVGQLMAMVQAGRIADAVATAAFLYDAAAKQPGIPLRAWAATLRGWTLLHAGRPDDAVGYFLEGESLWIASQLQGTARWCVAGVVLAAMNAGEPDVAVDAYERLAEYDSTGFRLYDAAVLLGGLWVARQQGRLRTDASVAGPVLAEVRRTRSIADASFAAHELARLGAASDAAAALALLDELLDGRAPGPLVAARRAFAEATIQQTPDQYERAAELFDAIGAALFAAEAFDRATVLHRRAGRAADARRLAGRAAQLLAAVGEVRSPLLTVDAERPGGLSKREEQIARLAADGWTNKRIADHLYLGERTIESHLYRAFQKLGVTSRAQLADALGAGSPPRTA